MCVLKLYLKCASIETVPQNVSQQKKNSIKGAWTVTKLLTSPNPYTTFPHKQGKFDFFFDFFLFFVIFIVFWGNLNFCFFLIFL